MHELEIVFYPGCRGSVKRFGYLAGLFSDRHLQYRLGIDPAFPNYPHLLRDRVPVWRSRCADPLLPQKKVTPCSIHRLKKAYTVFERCDSMKKVNPCCLCGSQTLGIWRNANKNGRYFVSCQICHNCGESKLTMRGAIRQWNKKKRPRSVLCGGFYVRKFKK